MGLRCAVGALALLQLAACAFGSDVAYLQQSVEGEQKLCTVPLMFPKGSNLGKESTCSATMKANDGGDLTTIRPVSDHKMVVFPAGRKEDSTTSLCRSQVPIQSGAKNGSGIVCSKPDALLIMPGTDYDKVTQNVFFSTPFHICRLPIMFNETTKTTEFCLDVTKLLNVSVPLQLDFAFSKGRFVLAEYEGGWLCELPVSFTSNTKPWELHCSRIPQGGGVPGLLTLITPTIRSPLEATYYYSSGKIEQMCHTFVGTGKVSKCVPLTYTIPLAWKPIYNEETFDLVWMAGQGNLTTWNVRSWELKEYQLGYNNWAPTRLFQDASTYYWGVTIMTGGFDRIFCKVLKKDLSGKGHKLPADCTAVLPTTEAFSVPIAMSQSGEFVWGAWNATTVGLNRFSKAFKSAGTSIEADCTEAAPRSVIYRLEIVD